MADSCAMNSHVNVKWQFDGGNLVAIRQDLHTVFKIRS